MSGPIHLAVEFIPLGYATNPQAVMACGVILAGRYEQAIGYPETGILVTCGRCLALWDRAQESGGGWEELRKGARFD